MTRPNAASLSASAARIEYDPGIPAWAVEAPFDPGCLPQLPGAGEERVVAYVTEARPVYDGLRRAAAQLAGVLVLAATGGKSGQDHPMIRLAEDTCAAAAEGLDALAPPPHAAHHHRHLTAAAASLGEAFAVVGARLHRASTDLDALNCPVATAIDHLRWAGQLLPGFEIVDFTQGCACHPGLAYSNDKTNTRTMRRGDVNV